MLEKGDRVILITDRHGNSNHNPVWTQGKGYIGTITLKYSVADSLSLIKVKWDNGCENSYDKTDLRLHKNETDVGWEYKPKK